MIFILLQCKYIDIYTLDEEMKAYVLDSLNERSDVHGRVVLVNEWGDEVSRVPGHGRGLTATNPL